MKKSVSTKKGDDGSTGLLDNSRIKKYSLRPETYGTLDEASAFLGLARTASALPVVQDFVLMVQNHIYLVNAELACPVEHLHRLHKKLTTAHLDELERRANGIEEGLELPPKFVLYGQSPASAHLDVARAVIRRAERRWVELNEAETIENEAIGAYLNRLSDALYLLARYEEVESGVGFAYAGEGGKPQE